MLRTVDPAIFTLRYFGHCLSCGFCADSCCQHGVDVSITERDRILARAEALSSRLALAPADWFEPAMEPDGDFPGGAATRTRVVNGSCVFLQRDRRGCLLHAVAIESGDDYHLLKPMVSALFPVTFGGGLLGPSDELTDASLVCSGKGPTAYAMARGELAWYFGAELVAELDRLAIDHTCPPIDG